MIVKRRCFVLGCPNTRTYTHLCGPHRKQMDRAGRLVNLIPKRVSKDPAVWFWRHAVKTAGCWIWTGPVGSTGRPRMYAKGNKLQSASRWVLSTLRGVNLTGLQANHTCHQETCVNPAHLYAGTQLENMRDKARANRGKNQYGAWESKTGAAV